MTRCVRQISKLQWEFISNFLTGLLLGRLGVSCAPRNNVVRYEIRQSAGHCNALTSEGTCTELRLSLALCSLPLNCDCSSSDASAKASGSCTMQNNAGLTANKSFSKAVSFTVAGGS